VSLEANEIGVVHRVRDELERVLDVVVVERSGVVDGVEKTNYGLE
jgi:hypothetical protein